MNPEPDPFGTFPGASFTSYLSAIFGNKQASVARSLSTANIKWTKSRIQEGGPRPHTASVQNSPRDEGNGLELISTGLR